MTQLFRLLWVVVGSLFRPALQVFDESELRFRVMPGDIDVNLHMNNARYLAVMDLGRWDAILRSGLWRLVMRRRLQPVIGGAVVRFRRPLRPFQRFSLKTRLITWDERWIYIEHRLDCAGVAACSAQVRAAFVGRSGIVRPVDVIRGMGGGGEPPSAPAWVQSWRDFDAGLDQSPPAAAGGLTCVR